MKHTYTDLREFVPQGWKVAPLRWYLSCKSGESIETNFVEKIPTDESNIPVIGGNGVMGYSNQINVNFETISIGRVGALCGNTHYINYPTWITDNSLLINRYNKAEINLEFLKFVLEQLNLNQYSTSTAQPLITGETIKKRKIALPSVDNQKKIVNYIYRKTSEIDELVNSKQKLINLLENQRQSIITEAVTKGLNPNVKMKDSGVEWIGEVSENINFVKLKYLVETKITDGPHETPILKDEGIPFISAEAIKNGKVDFNYKRGFISIEDHEKYSKKCSPRKGDIFMVKSGATTGKFGIVETEEEFSIWSPLALIRADLSKVNNLFLYYCFYSTIFQMQVQTGWNYGTQQNIGMGVIENLFIPCPSLEEQNEIVDYLVIKDRELIDLITQINVQIEKLKEYRQSLIYEAVTGKIDLRELELD